MTKQQILVRSAYKAKGGAAIITLRKTTDSGHADHGWLNTGHIAVNEQHLEAGDGAAVSDERQLLVTVREKAELLFFDLA